MTKQELDKLKFPLGSFEKPSLITDAIIKDWLLVIEEFPMQLRNTVEGLSLDQLNWTYRPNGWAIKQVIHHCSDSHMNSFIRFKLALTEDNPTIRPYYEDRWSELIDGKDDAIDDSLNLLTSLHRKWVLLLRSLNTECLGKFFVHPENNEKTKLDENIGIYAFHCQQHLEHIKQALNSKGKYNL